MDSSPEYLILFSIHYQITLIVDFIVKKAKLGYAAYLARIGLFAAMLLIPQVFQIFWKFNVFDLYIFAILLLSIRL
jgi:hypothetical protein